MFLDTLVPPVGSNKKSRRVGRGIGSGKGKTCGRGEKGAGARKSANKGFMHLEGGNFPLWRSVPKRGFKSLKVRDTQIVNLESIEKLDVSEVTPEVLAAKGLVKDADKPVKILARGELTRAVTVKASSVSRQAAQAIEKAGGKVEII